MKRVVGGIVAWAAIALGIGATAAIGKEAVIYSFCTLNNCADGQYPDDKLTDVLGTFYGTTENGGAYGLGTVFSFNPQEKSESVLYSFCSQSDCNDGSNAEGGVLYVSGTLYGVTISGGTANAGTIFSIDPQTRTETVLHSFQPAEYDGSYPTAGLIYDKGSLYGTTDDGGAYGSYGTVFSLNLTNGVENVVHSFGHGTDGQGPLGSLLNVKGKLYGTTYSGGTAGYGTVFCVERDTGDENVMYSFQNNGADGINPEAGLIDINGVLFGTTSQGGTYGYGTVFSIDPLTGNEKVLHSFAEERDGYYPYAALLSVSGTLFGTTLGGGRYSNGAAFSLDLRTGTERVIHSFNNNTLDGYEPLAALIHAKDKLYGTTFQGGASDNGALFVIRP